MYRLTLILKYLLKRRLAWFSTTAVVLCSALVLVTLSVMGGWLRMFKDSFRTMTGDVIVSTASRQGFEDYEGVLADVKRVPGVLAATPVIRTAGLVKVNRFEDFAQIIGLVAEPRAGSAADPVDRVMGFVDTLHKQHHEPVAAGLPAPETASFALRPDVPYETLVEDARFANAARRRPGIVVSTGLVGIRKTRDGVPANRGGLYTYSARVTVVPTSETSDSQVRPTVTRYWIVDDSRTGLPQHDGQSAYVDFYQLQRDLRMDEDAYTDADTGAEVRQLARANEVHVKLDPAADPVATQALIYTAVAARGDVGLRVESWAQQQATFINAIEKEKVLVTALFGMLSLVAVFLIFCIFYMIVVEKTRDIGILKSVGATGGGIVAIFLGYGALIGVAGGGLGVLVGCLVTWNINAIHDALGRLPYFKVQIWDPEVYAFDIIPNAVNPTEAALIFLVAVVAATLGALVPAALAAGKHPVEALRFE